MEVHPFTFPLFDFWLFDLACLPYTWQTSFLVGLSSGKLFSHTNLLMLVIEKVASLGGLIPNILVWPSKRSTTASQSTIYQNQKSVPVDREGSDMMWWADDGWQRDRVCQSVGRCGHVEQVYRQRMAAGTESASQTKDCVAKRPV